MLLRLPLLFGTLTATYYLNQYFEEAYYRRLRFIRKLARTYFKTDDGTEMFDD